MQELVIKEDTGLDLTLLINDNPRKLHPENVKISFDNICNLIGVANRYINLDFGYVKFNFEFREYTLNVKDKSATLQLTLDREKEKKIMGAVS